MLGTLHQYAGRLRLSGLLLGYTETSQRRGAVSDRSDLIDPKIEFKTYRADSKVLTTTPKQTVYLVYKYTPSYSRRILTSLD